MANRKLIIFVKAPRVGTVKTRLAKAMGPEGACEAYRSLVEIVVRNVSSLQSVEMRFTPDDAVDEIACWQRPGWIKEPQGKGDLGQRMNRAFEHQFGGGAERVVIIGSDCPEVAASDVANAWESLGTNDVVMGPATDGGYWLIGLRQPQPMLFDNMVWSTDTVFCETVNRAKAAGLKIHFLRELNDVDTERDWIRFSQKQSRGL